MKKNIVIPMKRVKIRCDMNIQNSSHGASILIVDDEELNRKLINTLLSAEGYTTICAASGQETLSTAAAANPDLILLDVMMPGMDGFETVRRLKDNERTSCIPVIMITSLEDRETKLRALQSGAEEFLTKPIDRADLIVRVRNLLRLKEYGDFLSFHNEILKTEVKERTARLEDAYRETLITLVRASEFKDEGTGLHINRIGRYACALAEQLGMEEEFIKTIRFAALMHDVGKIGIPDSILLKHDVLTPDEWVVMQTHCKLGADILRCGNSKYLLMGADIAMSHHEHWDGTGYPANLSGEAIPFSARITQIADVYDALRSRRPYKPSLEHATVMQIITEGDGRTNPSHFDPDILAVFCKNADMFNNIYSSSEETT